MRETIRHAAGAGLRTYEFLGRAEAWTTVWTNQERSTVTVRIFPFTPRDWRRLAADTLAAVGRKTLGYVRACGETNQSLDQQTGLGRAATLCRADRFLSFRLKRT